MNKCAVVLESSPTHAPIRPHTHTHTEPVWKGSRFDLRHPVCLLKRLSGSLCNRGFNDVITAPSILRLCIYFPAHIHAHTQAWGCGGGGSNSSMTHLHLSDARAWLGPYTLHVPPHSHTHLCLSWMLKYGWITMFYLPPSCASILVFVFLLSVYLSVLFFCHFTLIRCSVVVLSSAVCPCIALLLPRLSFWIFICVLFSSFLASHSFSSLFLFFSCYSPPFSLISKPFSPFIALPPSCLHLPHLHLTPSPTLFLHYCLSILNRTSLITFLPEKRWRPK